MLNTSHVDFHYKSKMNELFIYKPFHKIQKEGIFVTVIARYFRDVKSMGITQQIPIYPLISLILFLSLFPLRGNNCPEFWNLLLSPVLNTLFIHVLTNPHIIWNTSNLHIFKLNNFMLHLSYGTQLFNLAIF